MSAATETNRPLVDFTEVKSLANQITGAMYCGCVLLGLPAHSPERQNPFFNDSLVKQFTLIGEQSFLLTRKLRMLESLAYEAEKLAKYSKPKQAKGKVLKAAA